MRFAALNKEVSVRYVVVTLCLWLPAGDLVSPVMALERAVQMSIS